MRRGLGLAVAAALAAVGAARPAAAQYFGQNKVQYSAFDFRVIQTEHFDVHYYPEEREAAMDVARMAERSYARLSRVLNHQFRERKPIIVYASHADFVQTNATPGEVGEGTGGFTDFLKHRNIFPLTGDYRENEHVLSHEMTHQFQYDIWSRGRAGGGIATLMAVNPPLWFVEGMAEYMSLGPTDPNTAMWLRDAALTDKLPTIAQLTDDPRIFPYRFGHALLSYIGERWGDEAVGAILTGTLSGGLEASVKRTLGLTLEQLSAQWRDAVRAQYLPQIGTKVRAAAIAKPLLTEAIAKGTYHLAPALSPDGSQVAFFSERDFFFVDLWLADGNTGEVKKRLLKSSYSSNYETFRFINSQANWSPDGQYLAFAGKRGATDEIIVLDVKRNKQIGRIRVRIDDGRGGKRSINGVTTPAWSPDGKRLVFTGYDGGLSDLFVVDRDGNNLRRLTTDKYADLHPVWSPDGRTLAFATDRGPQTDFKTLAFGNMRIALYDLETGAIRVLDHMEVGRNSSPQWSPDGKAIAFVSDRTGVSNIFMLELQQNQLYQITDLFTGAQGITPLSPVLSWAPQADRLAFVYYEDSKYDVYSLAKPRSLERRPWAPGRGDSAQVLASATPQSAPVTASVPSPSAQVGEGGTIYRTPRGFRAADSVATSAPGDTTSASAPVSIAALLDSANLALPDTSEFQAKEYKVRFTPDYVARPSIGYVRDNFGRGVFGGSAIQLSDILGNQQLVFAGYVNGRVTEAQILAAYANLSHRLNWAVGVHQTPYYFLEASQVQQDPVVPGGNLYITSLRRVIVREGFAQTSYPFNRFQRVELAANIAAVSDDHLSLVEPYDPFTGNYTRDPYTQSIDGRLIGYFRPTAALVFDNTIGGYVGPLLGTRYRFEASQYIGGWSFAQFTGDWRRYTHVAGPLTLATRALYYGRRGRDANEFRIFLGAPDLLRGNTSGSYARNECRVVSVSDLNSETGCAALDRLVGTQIAVGSAELRFPMLPAKWMVLPLEGALFYDVGVAWDENTSLKFHRAGLSETESAAVRTPLQSVGTSIRANLFGIAILRFDYAFPINRTYLAIDPTNPGAPPVARKVKGFWTISLGPTF